MEKIQLIVPPEGEGKRVDVLITDALPHVSRSLAQRLCEEGGVLAGGKAIAKNHRVKAGERLDISISDPVKYNALPQKIDVDIVFEDDHLLVVNKPKGMVVHPAAGNPDGTLVNALMHHCEGRLSGIGGVLRPGIVHRIDKDTSGLLIVAKDDRTHQGLSKQIAAHSFSRVYQAVVYGTVKADEGRVEAPIGRNPIHRKQMCVTDKNAKSAVTNYKVVRRYEGFTHLELRLETGRTHQIRVHMAYIGHPVAGDCVYGPKKVIKELAGQCLHAGEIGFVHPISGDNLSFTSPLPEYFQSFLAKLGRREL